MEKLRSRHDEIYNALQSVEEADACVRTIESFDAALNEAGLLLMKAGLTETLAVRLLHKHNTISASEVMVEALETLPDGRLALSTVRTPVSDGRDRAISVWDCLPDGSVIPLEYTVECGDVQKSERLISDNRQLFASFNALMKRHSLDGVLGLCRTSDTLFVGDGEVFIETVDSVRDANVVVVERQSGPMPESLLPTTWEFTGDVVMSCVKKFCTTFCRMDQLTQCHKKSGHEGVHTGG